MYNLKIRGDYFDVNYKGEISGSRNWLVYAIVPRWNTTPSFIYQWTNIKRLLDEGKTVEGYLYDEDHGSIRFHGGKYAGKIPKAKIWK